MAGAVSAKWNLIVRAKVWVVFAAMAVDPVVSWYGAVEFEPAAGAPGPEVVQVAPSSTRFEENAGVSVSAP